MPWISRYPVCSFQEQANWFMSLLSLQFGMRVTSRIALSQMLTIPGMLSLFPFFSVLKKNNTQQNQSRSISEILRCFQRNEKQLVILPREGAITLYGVFWTTSLCKTAGQLSQLQNQDRCENEIPWRWDATAFVSLTSGSECKQQGHFISSMWASFTTLQSQHLHQATQINQRNHISVQV